MPWRGCSTPLPLSKGGGGGEEGEKKKKESQPKTAALLQSRINLPPSGRLIACLERQIAALPPPLASKGAGMS